jgi:hypothetical protein
MFRVRRKRLERAWGLEVEALIRRRFEKRESACMFSMREILLISRILIKQETAQ